jgi:predicted CXXCH cytochrome family protein
MVKRGLLLILTLLFFNLVYVGAAYAVVDNCMDCHHYNFQCGLVDRPTACYICHLPYIGGGFHQFNTANAINSNYTSIHVTSHKGGNWLPTTEQTSSCAKCHYTDLTSTVRSVYCKTCHTNVPHENHGNVSASGYYTDGQDQVVAGDGHGYINRTFSCISQLCHSTYWTGTSTVIQKPSCIKSGCHATDPHGTFPGTGDESGAMIGPNGTNPASKSDIAVKWLYQNGDTLKKSFDGLTWTPLTISGAVAGSVYTYADMGILNWTIVYYKITSGGSERYFPAYPPGANAHTNYMDNTETCAACHVTHAAEQAKLLKEQTIEDLCRTCHGLANTGSRYNVDTGEIVAAGTIVNGQIYATSYVKSNSGAFGVLSGGKYYAGNNAGTWGGAEVTSSHSTNSTVLSIAPGGGHNSMNLTCTSCHHSHPKKNAYRLLTIGDVEAYAVNTDATSERINYIQNMNTGCGCHQQYKVGQDSGHVSSATYFRHAVGVAIKGTYASTNPISGQKWDLTTNLPTEYKVYYNGSWVVSGTLSGAAPTQYVENGGVFCLTCHYAHGTIATGTNKSAYDLNSDSLYNDYSTMLKRENNDGACQECHKR